MRAVFAGALGALLIAGPVAAEPRHGISAFGELALPEGFDRLPYVNPDAPKGGRITSLGTAGRITFDSLNGFILKGVAAQELSLLFDTLMVRNQNEPDAVYSLVAKTADVAADRMSVTFVLDEAATFSDGSKLTADDVCATFGLLKDKGHPSYQISLGDVESCTVDAAVGVA